MNKSPIFVFLFVVWAAHSTSYITSIPAQETVLVKNLESTNSYVALVTSQNQSYIVKQKKRRAKAHWSILLSTMASVIAESIKEQLLSQSVWIIPAAVDFPGKYYKKEPASLHSLVSGKQVKVWQKDPSAPKSVQHLLDAFSIRLKNGFTNQLLHCMARHKDLPCIVAFCFLFGYQGCHNLNIFYDHVIDRFLLIDMDSCFKYSDFQQIYHFLFKQVYKSISTLFEKHHKKHIKITNEERNALLSFANALELIMKQNPISKINAIILDIYNDLKNEYSISENRSLSERIATIELALQKGYESAHRIIALIHNSLRTTTLSAM